MPASATSTATARTNIPFFNQNTGAVVVDFMKDGAIDSCVVVGTTDPTVWKVAGVGDFNHDGTDDILLFNQTSGDVFVDYINKGQISSYSVVGTANPTIWTVAGVGDFNGDGTSDILLYNRFSGDVFVDYMNQGTIGSYSVVGKADPSIWKVAGVGDYNGDGTSDILWFAQNSGTELVDFMNNQGVISSYSAIGTENPAIWQTADLVTGSSLLEADAAVAPAAGTPSLTQGQLQPIVQEAIARWKNAGLDAATLARMGRAQFVIGDLPGAELGEDDANLVVLDGDAAGNGWFVDPTPASDEEFAVVDQALRK